MGFGPHTSDPETGVNAVLDLVKLLYPEHSTAACQQWLANVSYALLSAHALLSFETISRFLANPDFRTFILSHADVPDAIRSPWASYSGPVDPNVLDPDLAWLIADRLAISQDPGPEEPT